MSATRNPIQGPVERRPEEKDKKLGPGYIRRASSIVGPQVKIPRNNQADQSQRIKDIESGNVDLIHEDPDTNSKEIDRADIYQDQDENYGIT